MNFSAGTVAVAVAGHDNLPELSQSDGDSPAWVSDQPIHLSWGLSSSRCWPFVFTPEHLTRHSKKYLVRRPLQIMIEIKPSSDEASHRK